MQTSPVSVPVSRLVSVGSVVSVERGSKVGTKGVVAYIYVKWNPSETKVRYRLCCVVTVDGREVWVNFAHCVHTGIAPVVPKVVVSDDVCSAAAE